MMQKFMLRLLFFNIVQTNPFQIQRESTLPLKRLFKRNLPDQEITFPQLSSSFHRTSSLSKMIGHATNINTRNLLMMPSSSWQITASQSSSLLVALTLTLSSALGFASDRFQIFGGSAGNIVTLVTAAFLSNVTRMFGGATAQLVVPTSHPFYDLCWTKFLPASLALVLFSLAPSASPLTEEKEDEQLNIRDSVEAGVQLDGGLNDYGNSDKDNVNRRNGNNMSYHVNRRNTTRDIISAVSIPFIIGSIGSILGCIISALIFCRGNNSYRPQPSMVFGSRLSPIEASVAAGCLCASYIGGTVNFFAAARILAKLDIVRKDTTITTSLFSSMAAADVLLMAIYFGGMKGAMSWHRMNVWFPGRHVNDDSTPYINKGDIVSTTLISHSGHHHEEKFDPKSRKKRKFGTASSSLFAALMAWFIVETSITFEKYTSHILPGMGCATVAAMGTGISIFLEKVPICTTKSKNNGHFWTLMRRFILYIKRDLSRVSSLMSDICFQLLFAAIGSSASIGAALCHGPTTLAFAALALLIHIICICFGSIMATKAIPSCGQHTRRSRILPLNIEEVLVASNAAIGGATTAAAFAGSLSGDSGVSGDAPSWSNDRKRGLVMAATVWGVFGYACATAVGVTVAKFLFFLLVK